jgi:hypothetical protein
MRGARKRGRLAVDLGEEGGDLKVVGVVLIDGSRGGSETDTDLLARGWGGAEGDGSAEGGEGFDVSVGAGGSALDKVVVLEGSLRVLEDSADKVSSGGNKRSSKGRSEGDGGAVGNFDTKVGELVVEGNVLGPRAEKTSLVVTRNEEVVETEVSSGLVAVERRKTGLRNGGEAIEEDGTVRGESGGSREEEEVETELLSVRSAGSDGLPATGGDVVEELEVEVRLETVSEEVGVEITGSPEIGVRVVSVDRISGLVRGNVVIRRSSDGGVLEEDKGIGEAVDGRVSGSGDAGRVNGVLRAKEADTESKGFSVGGLAHHEGDTKTVVNGGGLSTRVVTGCRSTSVAVGRRERDDIISGVKLRTRRDVSSLGLVEGSTSGDGNHGSKVVVAGGLEAAKATDHRDLARLRTRGRGLGIVTETGSVSKRDNDVLLTKETPSRIVIIINNLAHVHGKGELFGVGGDGRRTSKETSDIVSLLGVAVGVTGGLEKGLGGSLAAVVEHAISKEVVGSRVDHVRVVAFEDSVAAVHKSRNGTVRVETISINIDGHRDAQNGRKKQAKAHR